MITLSPDVNAAWGSWGALDYRGLNDEIQRIASYYASRGMYYSGARIQAQADARSSFYRNGYLADISSTSYVGPTFRLLAGDTPTITANITQGGTYTWQAAYVQGFSADDNGAEYVTTPQSFTVVVPPAATPASPAPTPTTGTKKPVAPASGAPTATAPAAPATCTAQTSTVASANALVVSARARVKKAATAAAKSRAGARLARALKVRASANAALWKCQGKIK